jgi:hypothetical protein
MPKRLRKDWRPRDVNQLAHHLVNLSTQDDSNPTIDNDSKLTYSQISRVMAAMGRKGGKIGGKRRLVTLTMEQRREIAIKAANKRWENAKKAT